MEQRNFNVDPDEEIATNRALVDELGLPELSQEDILLIKKTDRVFPINAEELTEDELVHKMIMFIELMSFAGQLAAEAKLQVAAYERAVDTKKAQVFVSSPEPQLEKRRNMKNIDPEVIELQEKLTKAEGRLVLFENKREDYKQFQYVLSRYLTAKMGGKQYS